MDRLKRITDLFVEGVTVPVGFEPDGITPILVWVKKLNSFETEEARRDGSIRRSERMAALGKEDDPQRMGLYAEMGMWSVDELAKRYVDTKAGAMYIDVYNDLMADPRWKEVVDRLSGMPEILADLDADVDDPRRKALDDDNVAWLKAQDEAIQKATKEAMADAMEQTREQLEAAFFEQWRDTQTLDLFMEERRVTQLYIAMRDCVATDVATTPGETKYDHSACNHDEKILEARSQVRDLPDDFLNKVMAAIDGATTSPREAGNSDAPASSSASSEHAKSATEDSAVSTPEGTLSEPPYELTIAIDAALRVLGWFEMGADEVPDENIWHHAQRLEEHFEAVKQRRETGMQPIEDADEADMTENELAKELRGGA